MFACIALGIRLYKANLADITEEIYWIALSDFSGDISEAISDIACFHLASRKTLFNTERKLWYRLHSIGFPCV